MHRFGHRNLATGQSVGRPKRVHSRPGCGKHRLTLIYPESEAISVNLWEIGELWRPATQGETLASSRSSTTGISGSLVDSQTMRVTGPEVS